MSILVTGGAGFIGSYTCKALLEQGEHVASIDDFNDFYSPKLKEYRVKPLLGQKRFKLYRGDIRDASLLKRVFGDNKIESVIHLAARAGVRASFEDPLLYESVNLQGTIRLLEFSKKVENFLFASSSSVYGSNTKIPFSEDDPIRSPLSPYAATKHAGELMCHTYHHAYQIPITCLRFFTVYGPMGRPDMVMFRFAKALSEGKPLPQYGDGSSKRDYTYITDIVAGVLLALRKPRDYEIINLGDSKPVALRSVISLLEKAFGKKATINALPMPAGDVPLTFADIRRAKRLLGYKPKIGIEEGIPKFAQWYKQYSKGL